MKPSNSDCCKRKFLPEIYEQIQEGVCQKMVQNPGPNLKKM